MMPNTGAERGLEGACSSRRFNDTVASVVFLGYQYRQSFRSFKDVELGHVHLLAEEQRSTTCSSSYSSSSSSKKSLSAPAVCRSDVKSGEPPKISIMPEGTAALTETLVTALHT